MRWVTTLLSIAVATPVFACEACFGAQGHAQTNGMNAAILTLLGVTLTVLAFMGSLVVRVAWRSIQAGKTAHDQESSIVEVTA